MIIYTYQPQVLIDKVKEKGHVFVDVHKTNMLKHCHGDTNAWLYEAYMWMGRKLGEKTGIWMKDVYGKNLNIKKDKDGDYIDNEGQKYPIFPFWGWYLTDGKNQKPDIGMYGFDTKDANNEFQWNQSGSPMRLLTLDVPEQLVLLSDANAWYSVMECRPCYDYETEEEEAKKLKAYKSRMQACHNMPAKTKQEKEKRTEEAEKIWQEALHSWDNIFNLEGRRLKNLNGCKEKYDVQAVFPAILKQWIQSIEIV